MEIQSSNHRVSTTPAFAAAVAALVIGVAGCSTLKEPLPEPEEVAVEPASTGPLAEVSKDVTRQFGPGKSGFHLIPKNDEALRWRLALVDEAKESVDAQYFIWERDDVGLLLMRHCVAAAERGVRVRLLVDDFYIGGHDLRLAAASHHPNFEIRIWNPRRARNRLGRNLQMLLDFKRLNRRMHNKMLVADNRVAIMGGRNVGNEYFGLSKKYNFVDLDVMVTGAIVPEISQAFDDYWNSGPAYPGKQLSSRPVNPGDAEKAFRDFEERSVAKLGFIRTTDFPVQRRLWTSELRSLKGRWHAGTASVVQDQPVVKEGPERQRFLDTKRPLIERLHGKDMWFVTPYLLPPERLYRVLKENLEDGAQIKFVTGSMGANDQTAVYSHFGKSHRRKLLENGIELFELRHDPGSGLLASTASPPPRNKWVSIHMKGLVADRKTCFIGTLNLDPRSYEINTENGLVISSPGLAGEMADYVTLLMDTDNSWKVELEGAGADGQTVWSSRGETRTSPPARSFCQRISSVFLGILPIEDQL